MFGRKAKKRQEVERFVASLANANGEMGPQALQLFTVYCSQRKIGSDLRDLGLNEIFMGLANCGMFIRRSRLLLDSGEETVWITAAQLLHEVKDTEFRGTSGGISIPLGHGFRYRVGEMRGHVVMLATHWEAADSGGDLTVTNRRILYSGKRKTLELPLKKLVTLNVFSDGLDLGASGQSSNATLRVRNPHLTAATIKGLFDHQTGIKLIEKEAVDVGLWAMRASAPPERSTWRPSEAPRTVANGTDPRVWLQPAATAPRAFVSGRSEIVGV
jgi:hypothetical protein